MSYDRHFYEEQRAGSLASAKAVVPLIVDLVKPRSVADVGCGLGTWLSVFRDCGIEDVRGFDGDYVLPDLLMIPRDRFQTADLRQPLVVDRSFDLVLSVEVAEHLPESAASGFVAALTRMAPVIVFSAAIPAQGGADHVNEQWQEYWAELFERHGCVVSDALRPRIWKNTDVEPFYRQNLLVFVKTESLSRYPALEEAHRRTTREMLSVVHPRVFTGRNSYPLAPPFHLMFWAMRLMCSKVLATLRSLARKGRVRGR